MKYLWEFEMEVQDGTGLSISNVTDWMRACACGVDMDRANPLRTQRFDPGSLRVTAGEVIGMTFKRTEAADED